MKAKTFELSGAALDWAVAKCEEPASGYKAWVQEDLNKGILSGMKYSTDWSWGGPIIEREGIALFLNGNDEWAATDGIKDAVGDAPLIAAMRCYVASKFGPEIELPEELEN